MKINEDTIWICMGICIASMFLSIPFVAFNINPFPIIGIVTTIGILSYQLFGKNQYFMRFINKPFIRLGQNKDAWCIYKFYWFSWHIIETKNDKDKALKAYYKQSLSHGDYSRCEIEQSSEFVRLMTRGKYAVIQTKKFGIYVSEKSRLTHYHDWHILVRKLDDARKYANFAELGNAWKVIRSSDDY